MRECSQTFSFSYRSPSRELRGDVTCCVPGYLACCFRVRVSSVCHSVHISLVLRISVLLFEIFQSDIVYCRGDRSRRHVAYVSAITWRNDARVSATKWRLIQSRLLFKPETFFSLAAQAGSNDRVTRANSEQSGNRGTTTWHARYIYTYVYVHIELLSLGDCVRLLVISVVW